MLCAPRNGSTYYRRTRYHLHDFPHYSGIRISIRSLRRSKSSRCTSDKAALLDANNRLLCIGYRILCATYNHVLLYAREIEILRTHEALFPHACSYINSLRSYSLWLVHYGDDQLIGPCLAQCLRPHARLCDPLSRWNFTRLDGNRSLLVDCDPHIQGLEKRQER